MTLRFQRRALQSLLVDSYHVKHENLIVALFRRFSLQIVLLRYIYAQI